MNNHGQRGFLPGLQDQFTFRKFIRKTHHVDRLKDKNHVTVSRDFREAFDESQCLFMMAR